PLFSPGTQRSVTRAQKEASWKSRKKGSRPGVRGRAVSPATRVGTARRPHRSKTARVQTIGRGARGKQPAPSRPRRLYRVPEPFLGPRALERVPKPVEGFAAVNADPRARGD